MLSPRHNNRLVSWEKRFAGFFHPAIQVRGKRYFQQKRVELVLATETDIDACVNGTKEYDVSLTDTSGTGRHFKAYCDCPHFQGGNNCKHLWAAILAADAQLRKSGPLQDDLEAYEAPRKPEPDVWKKLLFPEKQSDKQNPWEGAPGQYMLRYELEVADGEVRLSALKNKVNKDGNLGRQVTAVDPQLLREPDLPLMDRTIFEGLQSLYYKTVNGSLYGRTFFPGKKFENYILDFFSLKTLLPQLAATGRCRVFQYGRLVADPLRLGKPEEGSLEFELQEEADANTLAYAPVIRLGDTRFMVDASALFFKASPLYFIHQGGLHLLPGVDFDWVVAMRRSEHRILVPKSEIKEFFRLLETRKQPAAMAVPEDLAPTLQTHIRPEPCLEVELSSKDIAAALLLDYGGAEIAYVDQRDWILDLESWQRVARHKNDEKLFARQLEEAGFELRGQMFVPVDVEGLKALDKLIAFAGQGWRLRGRDKRPVQVGMVSRLRVSSGKDWFDLEGQLEFGELIIPLPQAIRAFLRGERQIALPNGETGLLPASWLERNARILQMGDKGRAKDTELHFHSAHALLLDDLLEEVEEGAVDQDFLALRQRMHSFNGISPQDLPQGFCGELRPYQREALGWFDFLAGFGFGGVLADDMGLGKTIQALAHLLKLKNNGGHAPALVVAPTSLLFNWRDEAARFTPGLRVLSYAGVNRQELAAEIPAHDLILTTYGLLRRDIQLLREIEWEYVILDESQAIKNPDSQTAKAARVLQARHRLCMTGTPVENRLDELWSQFQFLNPNMLGSRKSFESRFTKPIAQGDDASSDVLRRTIRPFLLRRTKDAVAKDLPEKQESSLICEMTPAQAKVYARMRDHYRSEVLSSVDSVGLERCKIKVLEGLLRLRQVACHPELVGEPKAGSGKLEECIRLLRSVLREGHKVLIFSQFTSFLGIVRQRLEQEQIGYLYLDGRTSSKERERRVATFQSPDGPPVFCISLKAGGVGLNLTAADYVFIMDPWWNPAVEAQAVDRTHRIGQVKKVFAYRLISANSIDEKVLQLQQDKRELAGMLEQESTSVITSLTRDDLNVLFS